MTNPNVKTVSEITRQIKLKLNREFDSIWVSGEISGLTRPSSGHLYFTLKDKFSQLNGIIWQSTAERLKFEPENGLEVVCGGDIDVYPQRGTYQLIVRTVHPKGMGELELARRQLENRLAKAGLFDPAHKKPIPRFPNHVAVVTSPTGAAIRDFLQVLTRRWPNIRVTIVPVKVQGEGAAHEIATGVHLCNHFHERPDVIVVTRGGGSPEDLWSFNEEIVVRSIFASEIPVISGVGHETDVMLSDLVADLRALTPSEAAEKLTPDQGEVVAWMKSVQSRMVKSLFTSVERAREQVNLLANRPVLTQPLEPIRLKAMDLDTLEARLVRASQQRLERTGQLLKELTGRLNSVNPLEVLGRGYTLTSAMGSPIRSVEQIEIGETIETRLADGTLTSNVVAKSDLENGN